MNPTIQKALSKLEKADYAGYFEEINKLSIPVSLKNAYSTHKGKFIVGKHEWDFEQQLRTFSSELNEQLQEKENTATEKSIQQSQYTMDTTSNLTTSDLHQQTYIFLFGTSEYAEDSGLTQMLNVEANLTQLYEVFVNEQGMKKENIRSFPNPTGDDIKHGLHVFLDDVPKNATLVFYFAGHGVLGEDHELYFTTPKTHVQTIESTGISAASVRKMITKSKASRKVVILDCCFSGDFTDRMASAEQAVVLQIAELAEKIKGSFIMTSSAQTQTSKFDPTNPNRPTYFTESLIQTLKEGINNKKDFLTTSDIYENIKKLYAENELDLPKPTSRTDNEGDDIILALNKYNQPIQQEIKTNTNHSIKVEEKQTVVEPKKETIMQNPNEKEELKTEILALINKDLESAFDKLDEVFKDENATYNDYCEEYMNQPNGFNKATFRSKLRMFVRKNV